MNVEQCFLIGAAGAALLVAWWYMAGITTYHFASYHNTPNGEDLALGIIIGLLLAPFAPVVLAVRFLRSRGAGDLVRKCVYKPSGRSDW